jgi:hypothetical protein
LHKENLLLLDELVGVNEILYSLISFEFLSEKIEATPRFKDDE